MSITYSSRNRRLTLRPQLTVQFLFDTPDRNLEVERLSAGTSVLPEQFFPVRMSRCSESPETALLRAVLEDAFSCLQKGLVCQERRVQRLAREAEAWFLSDDEGWPCSFVPICQVLGLEPSYIRRGLQRQRQARLTTARQKTRRVAMLSRRLAA